MTVSMIVWCSIGGVMGWLASLYGERTFARMVESVGVGIFGAFLGGDFMASMLLAKATLAGGISMVTITFAICGSGIALMLLALMRKAVGPMKAGTAKRRS